MPPHAPPRALALALALCVGSRLAAPARACYIQGVDSGRCLPGNIFAAAAPFCAQSMGGADNVGYQVCVPVEHDFFPNLTLARKDAWVRASHAYVVARRRSIERTGQPPSGDVSPDSADGTPTPLDSAWEGGMLDESQWHFQANDECARAYRNFICHMNFPRCDAKGQSLLLCRSVCENFFRSCRIADFLNRCYDHPEWYGASSKEADINVNSNGLPVYFRYFLPGMPFRDIEYAETPKLIGGELTPLKVVCTPSLPGGAAAAAPAAAAALLAAAAAAALALGALR